MQASSAGNLYFLLFKDDCSDYRTVYFIKDKTEVYDRMKDFINTCRADLKDGCVTLRTDRGLEFCSQEVEKLLRDCGVKHETSTPYTPQQNGIIERDNRTVVGTASSLLLSANLDVKYWTHAVYQSSGGRSWFLLFKDDCTDYRFIYFMKNKSEVLDYTQDFLNHVRSDIEGGCVTLRTDNGTEFKNEDMKKLLRKSGVKHEFTTPYCPEQKGIIERDNRTVLNCARSLLQSSNLEETYWAEAARTAVYLLNRTTNKRLEGKTPFELWYKKKPEVSHLKIFGSQAFIQVPTHARRKWDSHADIGYVLVGYNENRL
jgi:transposase InsO family protein